MLKTLKKMLSALESGITYLEESDLAFTKSYSNLRRRRRVIKRAIKHLERIGD
jgi:exonuclease VII small subunit